MLSLPDTIQTTIQENILLVKLNRPEKRNAFNDELVLVIEYNSITHRLGRW